MIVGDEFRTNPMSNQPGGCSVVVIYTDGQELIYPRIKNPSAYARTILAKSDKPIEEIRTIDIGEINTTGALIYKRKTNI